jgi:hypothetical protein
MAHTHEYMLGTTKENMVYVEELVEGAVTPPPGGSVLHPCARYLTSVSGHEYPDGYPWCAWEFPDLRPASYEALMSFLSGAHSARVYLKTRLADGTYATYTGIMHRPKTGEEASWNLGFWADVTIRFTMLEAVS